ncbi:MAG: hypothetical protein Q8P15_00980 [Nanoarchaeota archaeon]|nr:hypothetical protein [Nanoarchaeota archaeon]
MDLKVWVILAVAIIVIIMGILTIVLNLKSKDKKVDYHALFIMGVIWFLVGVIMGNNFFAGIGLTFMVIGLVENSKWEENKKNWNRIDKHQKKLVLAMIIVLGLLVLAGIIILWMIYKGIIY